MTIKTNVQAPAVTFNHNETLVIRSAVTVDALTTNHNETFRR